MRGPGDGTAISFTPAGAQTSAERTHPGWPTQATNPAPARDGRHARAQRTHQAILDGLGQCLEIGILLPTAKQTPKRADSFLRGCARIYEGTAAVRRALQRYGAASEKLER
ncbi:MAG: hypothetical protein P8R42_23285 [Candidatus Binatia bacterium]|nr:hypothetical protein [Candidatus Binatia bacterium]